MPLLDHRDRGRAALGELRAEQLVDDRQPVRALVDAPVGAQLRVVGVHAALEALGQLHLGELVRGVQVLRRVPVEEHRLLLLVQLRPAGNLRRLGADGDELEVETQDLDQLLVLLDVRRVAAEEHPLRARLGALEERLLALQPLPRLELRVLLHQVRRDVPADVPDDARGPEVDDRLLLGDEVLVDLEVDVAPVLEHDVDLAVGHRLEERRAFREFHDVDLAAEVLLEHVLHDVDVGGRTRPGVLVERDRAALPASARRAAGDSERGHTDHERRQHEQADCPRERTFRHPTLLLRLCHASPLFLGRVPCVTRSRAIPSARMAREATTPRPNSLRSRPWATW